MQSRPLTIGTRGSPLALAQAHEVRRRLAEAHGLAEDDIAVEIIQTSGDRITHKPLREFGGKGLFTKEIEEALLYGAIDMAVHSMKDMPTVLPPGLEIAALPPREDVRDAFLSPDAASLDALPQGAVLGTASLRRQAQLRARRPDLDVVPLRGNVQTRLRKLAEGQVQATILACAGLRRLGCTDHITAVIETDDMLPAVAQGAIGIEIRSDDARARDLVAALDDAPTATCVAAERAFLATLDGSCRTPIAGLAELDGEDMHFRGQILTPDGGQSYETERQGPAADGQAMGRDAAEELLGRAGPNFFEDWG